MCRREIMYGGNAGLVISVQQSQLLGLLYYLADVVFPNVKEKHCGGTTNVGSVSTAAEVRRTC